MHDHRERVGGRTRVEAEDSAGAASASKPGKSTLVESASADAWAIPRLQLGHVPAVQRKVEGSAAAHDSATKFGQSTLVESASVDVSTIPRLQLGDVPAAQRKVEGTAVADASAVHQAAAHGIRGAGVPLPYLDRIQQSFGRHDVSHIQAHIDTSAGEGARAMGAKAYAMGEHVAFARAPDLHTAAHEAAHVVQQRAGVHLKGGVGQEGDIYERHADAVADKVVAGESAEELLDTMAPADGGSASDGAVQHKLEYAAHHAIAPDAAKKAVKAELSAYRRYAKKFELKLGVGLFHHEQAKEGADAMLGRMREAMKLAGMDEEAQHKAFGKAKPRETPDLGVVLVKHVSQALHEGNLREKMSMVYQARGKIAEALDTLREKTDDVEAQNMIGDELKSEEMGESIKKQKDNDKPVSYAILARRKSVAEQRREPNKERKAELSEGRLERDKVPLSEREKRAAKPGSDGKRRFIPGRQFYVIPPDVRKRERDNLRRVVAGLSGSTDMYFHIAQHLKMPENERRQLRLAALGQMLVNRDHSYHEIMHVAKTRGGLDDYEDDLPIGYTQLAPLTPDDILATAGLPDFPGDAQIREVSSPMDKATTIETASPPGKGKSYPAALEAMKGYEANPSKANLEVVVARIQKWLVKYGDSAQNKFTARAQHLRRVLARAQYLLSVWDSFSSHDGPERALRADRARNIDNGSMDFLNRMSDLEGDHDDWYSPDFRAQTTDMALDTQKIAIKGDQGNLGYKDDINTDLKEDTATSIGQVRWELEAINDGDGRNVPDIEPTTGFMRSIKKRTTQQTARSDVRLAKDPQDFQNLDSSDLQALAPDAPLGGMLKRFEGKPVPQELHALNAYTQDGFYQMMNRVLKKRADKEFMSTDKGQDWWASVPEQLKQLISLAISAVRKMKPYAGTVYRGDNMVRGVRNVLRQKKSKAERQEEWKRQVSGSKTYNQFVSTSKRPHSSYAVRPGKYTAIHITNVKTGVDVSALGGKLEEREVLFAPGTRFKVRGVEDRFDTTRQKSDDRYGSRGDEAPLDDKDELGRIKVTLEEE